MRRLQSGQSLFELIVSIAISALIITAIVSLVLYSIRNATFSKNNTQAVALAQTTTEWLRSQRDAGIETFLSRVTAMSPAVTSYCFIDLNWSNQNTCDPSSDFVINTIFTRQGDFTVKTDVNGKTIIESNVMVKWTDARGTHEVNNITDFTDWRQK